MPRKPAIDRPIKLQTTLPESLRARLDLHLFSEVEGRVPHGAYQTLIIELLRQYFDWPAVEILPGIVVKCPPEAEQFLKEKVV